jgi:hypothetical protein
MHLEMTAGCPPNAPHLLWANFSSITSETGVVTRDRLLFTAGTAGLPN